MIFGIWMPGSKRIRRLSCVSKAWVFLDKVDNKSIMDSDTIYGVTSSIRVIWKGNGVKG